MTIEIIYENIQTAIRENRLDTIKNLLRDENPINIARLIRLLPLNQQSVIFRLLPKNLALDVFEQLDVEDKQTLFKSFNEGTAVELFSHLDPDDQVELLDELPANVANKLLSHLSQEDRNTLGILMGYPAESAGRIMTPALVRLKENLTVQQAIERIREVGVHSETIYYCYVTDEKRILTGVVSLRDLVMAKADALIKDIMKTDVIVANTHDDQEKVARQIQEHDFLAVPIVDKENRLVGIVTVDDAMDVLQEEATEDLFIKAGLGHIQSSEIARSYDLVKGNVAAALRARLPYLIITLFGGMLAGGIIGVFEESLKSILALAFFIPVIMDMGGNVGTQSSTIFTRGLLLGHITMNQFWRQLFREVKVGLAMGLFLGTCSGIFGWVWQGSIRIGLVLMLSILLTITLATVVGFAVPYALKKWGFDQAAGADPIITTIEDITGLIIYFAVATLFLGHLM